MKLLVKSLIIVLAWGTVVSTSAKVSNSLNTDITFREKGAGLVELIYTGKEPENLTIRIFGDKNQPIHKEIVRNKSGFKKPFNLREMPYGEYTFEVQTKNEKVVHKLNYKAPSYPGNVKVIFDRHDDQKFRYLVLGPQQKNMTLWVYDDHDRVVLKQSIKTDANYGKVFNFKGTRSQSLEFVLMGDNRVIHNEKVRL